MTDTDTPPQDPHAFVVLRDVIHELVGIDAGHLTPDKTFHDLGLSIEEYQLVFTTTCDRMGRNAGAVISTLPVYAVGASDWTMTSLQNWAPFSQSANVLLNRLNVCEEIDTLASVAETIQVGHFVASGKQGELAYPPRSKRYVWLWSVGLALAGFVVAPVALGFLPACGRVAFLCDVPDWGQSLDVLPVSGAIAASLIASAFLPGWLALRRDHKRRAN